MKKNIAVIGGGAAGMMAAYAAAKSGAQVTLYEKNEKLGKKIYITGKGRCNVTNDCSRDVFFDQVVTNPKFLYAGIHPAEGTSEEQLVEAAALAESLNKAAAGHFKKANVAPKKNLREFRLEEVSE